MNNKDTVIICYFSCDRCTYAVYRQLWPRDFIEQGDIYVVVLR